MTALCLSAYADDVATSADNTKRTFTIINKTYPVNKLIISCQDDACEKLSIERISQAGRHVTFNWDQDEILRKSSLSTGKYKLDCSKLHEMDHGAPCFNWTKSHVNKKVKTNFDEGRYLLSTLGALSTPLVVGTELITAVFLTQVINNYQLGATYENQEITREAKRDYKKIARRFKKIERVLKSAKTTGVVKLVDKKFKKIWKIVNSAVKRRHLDIVEAND